VPTFQLALRTALGFEAPGSSHGPSLVELTAGPVPVAIAFGPDVYVWHEAPVMRPFPDDRPTGETAPSLSVAYRGARERRRVTAGANRLLSALAFHFGRGIEVIYYAGAGGDSAYDAPFVRGTAESWRELVAAPGSLAVLRSPRLWLALALHREGMNSGSPFYGFLAHWNAIEAAFDVTTRGSPGGVRRDRFLNSEGLRLAEALPEDRRATLPLNLARYLADESRDAIAHVVRNRRDQPHLNPDDPEHLTRLSAEAEWIRALARAAIDQRWPNAIRIDRAHDPFP
jgi:hypothetical protein